MKKVRLEKLKDKEKENALNEVRILASIKHQHIIAYKEAFIDEATSCLCLVTELANGGDLFMKIQNSSKANCYIHEGEAWKIFIQVVFGLKKLHDFKILHRDLKSANVFLFKDGTVKLGDMNVSKVAKQGLLFTQTGTPYYASPEVWRDQPYDSKSDIWSLGCILYEMIALRPPFKGADMENLYQQVLTGKYQAIPNVYSQDMAQVIKSMLSVNPKMRPTCLTILTMEAVKKRIDKYFSPEYLLHERQTFQGQKKREQEQAEIKGGNEELLRTIRMSDNIFILKDRLPTPQYSGESTRTRRNRSVQQSIDQTQTTKTETEKKIENILPLSYLSPVSQKKESNTRNPSVSIDVFEIEPISQKEEGLIARSSIKQRLTSKKNSMQPSVLQSQNEGAISSLNLKNNLRNSQESIYASQDALTRDLSSQELSQASLVPTLKREKSLAVNLNNRRDKPPKQQSAVLKNSSSQKIQLPKIDNLTRSSVVQSDYLSSSASTSKISLKNSSKKNILLINMSNAVKQEQVPMSYLKGYQNNVVLKHPPSIFTKDTPINRNPILNRYNIDNKEKILFPELRGMSLESYKYIQDNKSKAITLKPLDERVISIPLLVNGTTKVNTSMVEEKQSVKLSTNLTQERKLAEKSLKNLISQTQQ